MEKNHQHSEKNLKEYCDQQVAIQKRLAEQGIDYVLIIPPSKASIYPEYIDSGDYTVRETAADIFADYLEEHSDIKVIRLKETLLEAKEKSDELLFFKTDTHWSYYGKYIGYEKIIYDLSKWGVLNDDSRKIEFSKHSTGIRDLARMLGPVKPFGNYLEESCNEYRILNSKAHLIESGDEYEKLFKIADREGIAADYFKLFKNDSGERALIYCDSMIFSCLASELAEHFSETLYLGSRVLDQEMLDSFKPNVVVAEMAERQLNRYLKEFGADYLKTKICVDKINKLMELDYFDNGKYETMYFPTWSELGGQDDLIWYQAQRVNENTWHVTVDLNRHHTNGIYSVHFYYENNGLKRKVYGVSYDMGSLGFD